MEQFLSGIWYYGVMFVVVLTVLVYVHELGHYLVARRCGVRVDVFSIGFGRELFGWTDVKSGTRWKFSAIPLGGYVKMFGEHDLEEKSDANLLPGDGLSPEEQAVSFSTKTVGQRAAIVAAGPLANLIFAVFVFAALFMSVGQPFTAPVITGVVADSAAARAGFAAGDVVVEIDGKVIERFQEIQSTVQVRPGAAIDFLVNREGAPVTLTAIPERVVEEDRYGNSFEIGRLGIQGGQREYVRLGPVAAVITAGTETVDLTRRMLSAVWEIISGTRDSSELGGPIRIAQMAGDVAQGSVLNLIYFTAVLSINLALINLFPIPMLDGGHLMFYAAEAVRGRPVGARLQEMSFRVGLALVLTLILFVTINDIAHLQVFEFVRSLVG